jgi:hypothetical protein
MIGEASNAIKVQAPGREPILRAAFFFFRILYLEMVEEPVGVGENRNKWSGRLQEADARRFGPG